MNDNTNNENQLTNFLSKIIEKATKRGANSADAIGVINQSLSISQRLGKREDLERSESNSFGLRVFIGKRQSIVSSSDKSDEGVNELIDRAIEMAKIAPEDPYVGISESESIVKNWKDLNLIDNFEPDSDWLYEKAAKAEDAALSLKEINNSEGGESSWSKSTVALANSHNFYGSYSGSMFSISAAVIAGSGSEMERDYDYSVARLNSSLDKPENVGINAAKRAIKRLKPIKIDSAEIPVLFDWRVASSLLGHFSSAINGQSIAKNTSFLSEKLNQSIFKKGINIIDDPLVPQGLGSRPFDGEAIECKKINLVSDGVLNNWILDLSSSRQLGLKTNGHASRGVSSVPFPSTSNLYLESGDSSVDQLMNGIKKGIYVTELIGMGVNTVNGDYSRGAAGFLIENGKISSPVSEITVAGNLISMFANITPANDLNFKNKTNSPSILIENMTVAGN